MLGASMLSNLLPRNNGLLVKTLLQALAPRCFAVGSQGISKPRAWQSLRPTGRQLAFLPALCLQVAQQTCHWTLSLQQTHLMQQT